MKLAFAILAVMCFGAASASAQNPNDYRYTIPLVTQNAEGLHRVEIPLAVYQGAARADLGDLRVFNGRGERVPFAFAGEAKRENEKPVPLALPYFPLYRVYREGQPSVATPAVNIDLHIKQQADGTLISLRSRGVGGKGVGTGRATKPNHIQTYIVDASRTKEPINALQLDWESRGGEQAGQIAKLRVESSDDLKFWQTLVAGAPLLNLEFGGERLVQKRVEFSPAKAKYLRLTWDRDGFDIKSLLVEIPETQVQPGVRSVKVEGAAGDRAGDYLFDLGAQPPVERLQLSLPQSNTVALAQIFSRSDAKAEWRTVATATFYRLTRESLEVVSPPVSVSARSDRYWLVRVDQKGGGLGSGTPQIEAGWTPRQIVFVARGEGPYFLAYGAMHGATQGKSDATPANYPVSTLLPGYKPYAEYALPLAQSGVPVAGGGEAGAFFALSLRDADGKRITLWAILILGVALLAWMAWRLTSQMNRPAGVVETEAPPNDTAQKAPL